MPPDTTSPSTLDVFGPPPSPAAGSRPRGTATARRGRRWRRRLAIACGLVAAGLGAAFAWSEFHPTALAQADAAYRRNDLESALRLAEGHLSRRPYSRHATLIAARCLSRLDRPDQAEPYYQKAGPLDLEDRHIRAHALVLGNRREPAIRAYQDILVRRPDDVLALRRMAAVLISQSRWAEALETADRLMDIPNGAVIGHTLAGVVHHNTGESEKAVVEFDRVLELDPALERMPLKPRSMFWAEFGVNLLSIGRVDDARRHLHRALREGDDAKLADLLGQSYYLRGEFDDAERCWRLALRWDRNRFDTWLRIGQLELQRGRPAEAIEPLRRAAVIEPEAVAPVYGLGLAYRRLGRKEDADRFEQQANRLRGKDTAPPLGGVGVIQRPSGRP